MDKAIHNALYGSDPPAPRNRYGMAPRGAAPNGSRSHHKRIVPRQNLTRLLAQVLANWEIGDDRHDQMARHHARELLVGLNKLGVL
jgi:hypothetical protein